MSNLQNKFEDAKLLLLGQKLRFFGLCSTKFNWVASDLGPYIEGMVKFHKDRGDDPYDKNIHLNETYITKSDYTSNNLVDLIIHEIMHVMHRHHLRGKNRNNQIWAVATDHVIDRTIKSWRLTKPYVQHNIVPDLNKALPECTEEEAYEWLKNNKQFITIRMKPGSGNGGQGQVVEVIDQHGNVLHESTLLESDGTQEEQNEYENIISDFRAIHESLKERGIGGGGMSEYLDKVLKVEIPWETLLRKAIKTKITFRPDDRSWIRPNKYLRPLNIYLPGEILTEDKDGVGTLVFHIDTSGSMSTNDLKKGAHVIMESIIYFQRIIVITADYNIHQIKEFNKNEFGPFWSFIKEGMKGRGGTSHKEVFEHCQTEIYDEDPEEFSMFISFTDCYSDIKETIYDFKWCKNIPMIFVTNSSYKLQLVDFPKLEQIFVK